MKPARRTAFLSRALILLGAVLLAWVGLQIVEARMYQAKEKKALDALLSQAVPDSGLRAAPVHVDALKQAVSTRAEAARTGLVGRLEIPRLGLSVIVADGDDERTLRRAAGRIPDTAFPGESGNVGIAGHRDTFFRPLKDIRTDDTIRVTTPDGTFTYRVSSIDIVSPDRTDVLAPTPAPSLTLVTCYPFYYVGHAPQRYIVSAALVPSGSGSSLSALPDSPSDSSGPSAARSVARTAGGRAP